MALDALTIKNLAPKNETYEVKDDKGLFLRVMRSGRKTWVFRYYMGYSRRATLGTYPHMGLAEARFTQAAWLKKIEDGIDPIQEAIDEESRRLEEEAQKDAQPTFADALNEYWEKHLIKRRAGHATRKLIEHDALPEWMNRKINSITRRDVINLKDKVDERAPVTANRLVGALSKMFNVLIRRGVLENNPCLMVERSEEKPRDRVLSDLEIRLLWEALEIENRKIDLFRSTKLSLKMILICGVRGGEVSGARWDEFTETEWNIPGQRTKNGDAMTIPLTPMMLGILEQARLLSAGKPFVFASSHADGPLTTRALSVAVSRHYQEMGIEKFTPHDIRRTVRTKLAEIGIDDHIAERMMGHKLQGMMAIYNRHSYFDEKQAALLRWESHLKKLVGLDVQETTGNVIAVNFGKR